MELQKYTEDIAAAVEEIEDGVKDREDELTTALDKANSFDSTMQVRNRTVPGRLYSECAKQGNAVFTKI